MSSFLVLQYDDRQAPPAAYLRLAARNAEYCRAQDYHYAFLREPCDVPPYWAKVFQAQRLLPEYAGVLWLDTDACVHDASVRLEELVEEGKSFYLSPDNAAWRSPFNAGVWLVLNTADGRQIMRDWLQCYDASAWRLTDRWVTSGRWAGPAYEQGSFCKHVLRKHKRCIRKFEWPFFQSTMQALGSKQATFTVHFPRKYGKEAAAYLEQYADSVGCIGQIHRAC
jgi:hypothetical protein